MKATDLMIGDWISYSNEFFRIDYYHRITDTIGLMYAGKSPNFGNGVICAEDALPIPLTSEILEKNRFYKDWDNKTYLMGELFRLTPLTDGMGYCVNKWVSMQIYSVHQLQHALRLCGLDELADNFKI